MHNDILCVILASGESDKDECRYECIFTVKMLNADYRISPVVSSVL